MLPSSIVGASIPLLPFPSPPSSTPWFRRCILLGWSQHSELSCAHATVMAEQLPLASLLTMHAEKLLTQAVRKQKERGLCVEQLRHAPLPTMCAW